MKNKIINLAVCAVLTVLAVIYPLTNKNVKIGSGGEENAVISSFEEFKEVMSECSGYTLSGDFKTSSFKFYQDGSDITEIYGDFKFAYNESVCFGEMDVTMAGLTSSSVTNEVKTYSAMQEVNAQVYIDNSDSENEKCYIKFLKMISYMPDKYFEATENAEKPEELKDYSSICNQWFDFSENQNEATSYVYYSQGITTSIISAVNNFAIAGMIDEECYTKSSNKFLIKEDSLPIVYPSLSRVFAMPSLQALPEGKETYDDLIGKFEVDFNDKNTTKIDINLGYSDTGEGETAANCLSSVLVGQFELSNVNNTKITFPSNAKISEYEVYAKALGEDENE